MKTVLRWLRHLRRTPMHTRIDDDLYEAEKQLLHYEAQAEFSVAMAAYHRKRVKTLRGYSNARTIK